MNVTTNGEREGERGKSNANNNAGKACRQKGAQNTIYFLCRDAQMISSHYISSTNVPHALHAVIMMYVLELSNCVVTARQHHRWCVRFFFNDCKKAYVWCLLLSKLCTQVIVHTRGGGWRWEGGRRRFLFCRSANQENLLLVSWRSAEDRHHTQHTGRNFVVYTKDGKSAESWCGKYVCSLFSGYN